MLEARRYVVEVPEEEVFEYVVVGISPLLSHNEAAMRTDGRRPKKDADRIPQPEVEAEMGVYQDPDGNCRLPMIAFRNALLTAAAAFRDGRKSLASTLGHMRPAEEWAYLFDPETGERLRGYEIDVRRAVVKRQGVRRARPRFDRWACRVRLVADSRRVRGDETWEFLRNVLVEAGTNVGVGDYRPEKKGWFGRFGVVAG